MENWDEVEDEDAKQGMEMVKMFMNMTRGVLIGLLTFVCISLVSYGQFKIEYLLLFVKAYSTGLGSVPMKYVGPHVLLM